MFKAAPNPYDEIVVKATDDHQTSENWEVIISLCDKVIDEGENGARNVIAAILKRLAHRTSNVQLYALSLAEALEKNCTIELHRELASKSFTQGVEKLITDRNTHDKVRKRALALIKQWSESFQHDPTLGIMNECYENLKSKGYKFEGVAEAPPVEVDDEIRRREEEELQRVLEMSKVDKGGRGNWVDYSGGGGSSSAAAQSSSAAAAAGPSGSGGNRYPSGYAPSASPALTAHAQNQHPPPRTSSSRPTAATAGNSQSSIATEPAASIQRKPTQRSSVPVTTYTPPVTSTRQPAPAAATPTPAVAPTPAPAAVPAAAPEAPRPASRVRALHKFEPSEPGELGFEKGDVIKVVDRGYKDWWRGQLRGKTGIFPVNYVEAIPEPTEAEIIKEAQAEAQIFAQAAAIDQLLEMLKGVDPLKDNLADNEEIQELYRSSMTLRPKIVKLIDRYSQKKADLLAMNDSFVKARKVYDTVMEESLAKYNPGASLQDYTPRMAGPPQGAQPYGWNPGVFNGQYQQQPQGSGPPPGQYGPQQPQFDAPPQQYQQQQPQQEPPQQYVQPYGAPTPQPNPMGGYQPQQQPPHQQQPQQFGPTPNPFDQSPQSPPPQQGTPAQGPYGQPQQYQQLQQQLQQQFQQQQAPQSPSVATTAQTGFAPMHDPAYARPGTAVPEIQAQSPLWAQQPQALAQPQQQPQVQNPPLAQAQPQAQGQPPAQRIPSGFQPQGAPSRQTSLSYHGPLPQPGQQHPQPQPGLQQHRPSFSVTSATPTSPIGPGPSYHAQQQQQQPQQTHVQPNAIQQDVARGASPPVQQSPVTGAGYAQPMSAYPTEQQQPIEQQQQPHAEPQSQSTPTPSEPAPTAPSPESNVISGNPPFPWDPTKKYADAGADAWAQYYAKGGTDPAGRVYFIPSTLPGATPAAQTPPPNAEQQGQPQPQVANGATTVDRHGAASPTTSMVTGAGGIGIQRNSSFGAAVLRKNSYGAGPQAQAASQPQSPAGNQTYGAQQQQPAFGEPNYVGRLRPQSSLQSSQHPPYAQFMNPHSPDPALSQGAAAHQPQNGDELM